MANPMLAVTAGGGAAAIEARMRSHIIAAASADT